MCVGCVDYVQFHKLTNLTKNKNQPLMVSSVCKMATDTSIPHECPLCVCSYVLYILYRKSKMKIRCIAFVRFFLDGKMAKKKKINYVQSRKAACR